MFSVDRKMNLNGYSSKFTVQKYVQYIISYANAIKTKLNILNLTNNTYSLVWVVIYELVVGENDINIIL